MTCRTQALTNRSDAKRSADNNINWRAVAYDLSDVDWDKVNWSSVFNSLTLTPTTQAAQATPTVAPTSTVATPVTQDTSAAPTSSVAIVKAQEVQSSAAASTTAAAPSSSAAATTSSSSDGVVTDLLQGVESIVKSIGIVSVGKNDESDNGAIWIGDDSDWKAEFTNDADEEVVIFCWNSDGYSGMCLNVNQPEISVGLKSGEKTILSFAANVPAACAPAFSSTTLSDFGGLNQTWWEVTFGEWGAFDVSREVNMNGRTISSKGSKCTSDMDVCVFKCKEVDGVTPDSCESGSSYELYGCDASSGGGGGYDTATSGTGGGCSMGSTSETVQISVS